MKRHKVIVNKTTVLRIGLTSILCSMLYGGRLEPGLLILMVILTTDYLEGFLARKLGGETDLGVYLDVFADFYLVISVFYVFVFFWSVFSLDRSRLHGGFYPVLAEF